MPYAYWYEDGNAVDGGHQMCGDRSDSGLYCRNLHRVCRSLQHLLQENFSDLLQDCEKDGISDLRRKRKGVCPGCRPESGCVLREDNV